MRPTMRTAEMLRATRTRADSWAGTTGTGLQQTDCGSGGTEDQEEDTMSTTTEIAENRYAAMAKATGIFGVALLTVTACGGTGGDEQPEDTDQEDVDPDGAEDQGDEPAEIAEDEDDSAEDEEDSGEAPEIAEIADEIWTNMENSESVTLDATVPFDAEDFEGTVEVEGAETIDQHYSGQIDGSALTFSEEAAGAEAEYITFDGETYLRGEHELEAFLEQYPGEFEEDELREEFEGKWVEYTEFFAGGVSVHDWFDEFRGGFEEAGGFGELEGAAEERDGEEVWVYTDDAREFVVRAGDEPVFLSLYADNEGEVFEATFSDWDEAEEPEEPDEEDVLTMEDLEGLLN